MNSWIIPILIGLSLLTGILYYIFVVQKEEKGFFYRNQMIKLVQAISQHAKSHNPQFQVIPNNGLQLLTVSGEAQDELNQDYLNSIDGILMESVYYGLKGDDQASTPQDSLWSLSYLRNLKKESTRTLIIDYCHTPFKIDDSYQRHLADGFLSFAAKSRALDSIPKHPAEPININKKDINNLQDAQNFLYLINPNATDFPSRQEFLDSLQKTKFDILFLDLFHWNIPFTKEEITLLKTKPQGGKRLIIAYMSVGEASNFRYYWQDCCSKKLPKWVKEENKMWPGSYKVKYWHPKWNELLWNSPDSYLSKIQASSFDGILLDVVDSFLHFESPPQ